MSKEKTIALLVDAKSSYLSGEEISRTLGVSRAAVWKNMQLLREDGFVIEAKTNRGYRLVSSPDIVSVEAIEAQLERDCCFRDVICLEEVDSTNSHLKRLAASGAEHGTVLIADCQTAGRGRMGRAFASPGGKGLYLSLLLRPETMPPQTMALTAFAAVAVCEAIAAVCTVRPNIKWVNDILVDDRKLCGILTEMSMNAETGQVDYIVIGAGINVLHQLDDFPPGVRDIAVSLAMLTDEPVSRAELAATLMGALSRMYTQCLVDAGEYTARYRELSASVGRDIFVIRHGERRAAFAVGIADDCGLTVRYPDGTGETLTHGETSIRGAGGYV